MDTIYSEALTENCDHYWIPNGGRGGEPDFRPNRHMSNDPLMHVRCSRCGIRTWFTEKQWQAIPAAGGLLSPEVCGVILR